MGSEILGRKNAGPGRNAHEQNQQQIQNRPGRSHGGQRRIADVLAYDDGVHRIVKLLSQIADQQRNRKTNQAVHGTAYGHVLNAKPALQPAGFLLLHKNSS